MPDTDLLDLETPLEDIEEELPEGEAKAEGETDGQEEQPDGEKPPAPTSLFQPDGKKLDPAIKTLLGEIKAKSPEAGRLVSKALYDVAELRREFPGGLSEAKELRDKIDGLGGVSAIEERIGDLEYFDGIDKKFTSGDPAFVDDLAGADPAAFSKIAPAVFAKFAEVSPDGWKKYIGGIVYGDFQRNEIPVQISRLADSLRRKDEAGAIESFNAISAYLSTFKELAELRVEAPRGKAPESRTDDLSKREMDLRAREWQSDHAQIERGIVQEEYRAAVGSRKPSTEEKAQIQELFLAKRQTLAKQYFPDQAKKLDALRNANDKAGFMRLATVMHKRVAPEAMRWAVSRTLKPAKATTSKLNQQQREQPRQQSQQNGAGIFKFVGAEPDTWAIDYSYPGIKQLLGENKAVLKDGVKVQWRDKK